MHVQAGATGDNDVHVDLLDPEAVTTDAAR
jgi:hypothetical protein